MKIKVSTITHYSDDIEDMRKIVYVYETFEEVIRKVNRDLQSLWNSIVPFPYQLILEAADDDEPLGLRLYNHKDELLAKNDQPVADALEMLAMKLRGDKNAK